MEVRVYYDEQEKKVGLMEVQVHCDEQEKRVGLMEVQVYCDEQEKKVDRVNVGQEWVSQCQQWEKYLVMEVRIVSVTVSRMRKHPDL